MSTGTLLIESSDKNLILSDKSGGEIISNRRLQFQLKEEFENCFFSDSSIIVPIGENDREGLLQKIVELLKYLDYEIDFDENASYVISSYLQYEADFQDFSKLAKNIWHGNIDQKQLEEYSNVLAAKWPSRRLYKLQLLASYHLAFSQNACNFSVPGAGKTSTVLGAYSFLSNLAVSSSKYVNKILVVGPLSCFQPWEDEFHACFGRTPKSFRISGESAASEITSVLLGVTEEATNIELILVSYQSLFLQLQRVCNLLKRDENRFMVVLDEAHRAKNTEGGRWSTSVLEIAKYASSRVVLTGTPAPNGFQDLYNLFEFIWPGKNIIGYAPGHLSSMTEQPYDQRRKEVIENITPYFVRIAKRDLGIAKEIEHSPTIVPMGKVQQRIYDYIESSYIDYFSQSDNNPKNALVKSRLIRMMQAASNPRLLIKPIENNLDNSLSDTLFLDDSEIFESIQNYSSIEVPPKITSTIDLAKSIVQQGKKLVVWCYYIGNILELQERFLENGLDSKVLYGAIPPSSNDPQVETRESIISEFHSENCPYQILICNPYAVGESISLHKACQHAVYLERNFNAAVFLQSKDRIHRYGMPENSTAEYDYIISLNSVDETIDRRLEEKRNLMMEVVESRDIPLLNITRESSDAETSDIQATIDDYLNRK